MDISADDIPGALFLDAQAGAKTFRLPLGRSSDFRDGGGSAFANPVAFACRGLHALGAATRTNRSDRFMTPPHGKSANDR
jgi:hypothetical protein